MHILVVGLSHKSAPLEVRERVSFSKEQLTDALPRLKALTGEGVIQSTCNRTEIYTASEDPDKTAGQVRAFLADFHGIYPEVLSAYLFEYTDDSAVRHLFRVASGLDSMILGESEILGQVRDALSAASDSKTVELPLVGLFHAAVRAGRRVREETEVGRNAISISSAGVDLARRVLGTLTGQRALLIGAGEAGRLVAQALRTAGVSELVIANRTIERGEELARGLGGSPVRLSDIEATLPDTDIVLAATDSPDTVITREMVGRAADQRTNGPLFIFDLAVPRDVDPQVGAMNGVRLFNIEDLSSIAQENLGERERAAADAETIVGNEVGRFMSWWESLDAAPIIKDLRQRAEDIRQRELGRAVAQLPDLEPAHLEVVEALTRSIVNRLLHEPTAFLRQHPDKGQLQVARDLFRLWDDS